MKRMLLITCLIMISANYAFATKFLFGTPINHYTGRSPMSVFASDLDGDGDNDLAVANNMSDNIAILINNGDGTFQRAVSYAIGQYSGPYSIIANDFDGDGNNDIAVVNMFSSNVSILKNNGNGTFQSAVNYPVVNLPVSIFACDFDNDGYKDLAVVNMDDAGTISMLKNNGDGTFQEAINYSVGVGSANSIFASDIDGDGDNDLVATYGLGVALFENSGDGAFQPPVIIVTDNYLSSVFLIDLDGDGDNDIFAAGSRRPSSIVSIFKNNGDGTFQDAVNYGSGSETHSIFSCDLDGDGSNDLVTANFRSHNISVLINNGDGTFQTAVNYAGASYPEAVIASDLNGDGRNDLVVASSNYISVFLNNPYYVGVEQEPAILPLEYNLSQNYPNPFNSQTKIQFDIPAVSHVSMNIFDILGRRVSTLLDGERQAGRHQAVWNADGYPSGIYFYKLTTDGYSETKRMILLK
jgi:hypothetical protein